MIGRSRVRDSLRSSRAFKILSPSAHLSAFSMFSHPFHSNQLYPTQIMTETNPYLKRLDQLKEARQNFDESEWRLSFLRTIEAEAPKPPTEQEIILWSARLN